MELPDNKWCDVFGKYSPIIQTPDVYLEDPPADAKGGVFFVYQIVDTRKLFFTPVVQ
jgi:hypothetical protein